MSKVRSCQRPGEQARSTTASPPQGLSSRTAPSRRVLVAYVMRPYFYVMEVWGFEPQTYGLQSHRSSHLSYTPVRISQGALFFSHG